MHGSRGGWRGARHVGQTGFDTREGPAKTALNINIGKFVALLGIFMSFLNFKYLWSYSNTKEDCVSFLSRKEELILEITFQRGLPLLDELFLWQPDLFPFPEFKSINKENTEAKILNPLDKLVNWNWNCPWNKDQHRKRTHSLTHSLGFLQLSRVRTSSCS